MPTEILVIGAGGHSKVVIEATMAQFPTCSIRLADQDILKEGKALLGRFSIEYLRDWSKFSKQCHIAIGNNQRRQELSFVALEHGKKLFTVVYPDACVSPSASLGNGSFVAAKAVIAAETVIGEGCIINHGAIVDHDCHVGPYSHISPGATLVGGVEVGTRCIIGAGATILPSVRVGHHVIVGAGAVITRDVPDYQIVVGVPGRRVSFNE